MMDGQRAHQPGICAIVVSQGFTDTLDQVLYAVSQGSMQPTILVVANVGTPEDSLPIARRLRDLFGERSWVVDVPGARNFGDAVRQTLTSDSVGVVPQYLWLLHDDSAPHQETLSALVERIERGVSIAAVGPKQVRWGHPSTLIEVGIEATRGARRLPLAGPTEIDQGQYDGRTEVQAVGTAGMLIRGDIWNATRGCDPALGPFGDSIEFGRRLRRAGYRVVVVPSAVIEHAQRSYQPDDPRSSYALQRHGQLYNWLVSSGPLGAILFPLWLLLWTPLRALGRLVSRQPRLAAAELRAGALVFASLAAVARARRRIARSARVPRSALVPLESTVRELRGRKRAIKRAERAPRSETTALDQSSAHAWRIHQRRTRSLFLFSGMALLAVSLVLWFPYLQGAQGGLWANLPLHWSQLWQEAWSLWVLAGNGAPPPVSSLLPVLSLVSAPFALLGVSPLSLQSGLMVAALPLAFVSGWVLASTVTRSLGLRWALGLLWCGSLPMVVALDQGDLAGVTLTVMAPLVFSCLWRIGRPLPLIRVRGIDDNTGKKTTQPIVWAGVSALMMIVAVAASPWMILVFIPMAYLLALLPASPSADKPSSSLKKRALAATLAWVPAMVWVMPSLVASLRTPGQWLFRDSSIDFAGLALPAVILGGVATAAIVTWAIVSLVTTSFSTTGHSVAVRVCAAGAVISVGIGLWLAQFSGFPVPLASLTLLLLAVAGLSGVGESEVRARDLPTSSGQKRRGWGAALLATAGLAGIASLVVIFTLVPTLTAVQPPIIPALAQEGQNGPRATRLLVLDTRDDVTVARLWRGSGLQLVDLSPGLIRSDSAGDMHLAQAVGTLAGRPSSVAPPMLATHAINLIQVSETEANQRLRAHLDASPGLERIGTTEQGTLWRVRVDGIEPSRVSVDEEPVLAGPGQISLDVNSAPGTLYLAESADPGWVARLDGQMLPAAEDPVAGWRQAFEYPGGAGHLSISYRPGLQATWSWGAWSVVGLALVLAIPWRRNRLHWSAEPGIGTTAFQEADIDAPE